MMACTTLTLLEYQQTSYPYHQNYRQMILCYTPPHNEDYKARSYECAMTRIVRWRALLREVHVDIHEDVDHVVSKWRSGMWDIRREVILVQTMSWVTSEALTRIGIRRSEASAEGALL